VSNYLPFTLKQQGQEKDKNNETLTESKVRVGLTQPILFSQPNVGGARRVCIEDDDLLGRSFPSHSPNRSFAHAYALSHDADDGCFSGFHDISEQCTPVTSPVLKPLDINSIKTKSRKNVAEFDDNNSNDVLALSSSAESFDISPALLLNGSTSCRVASYSGGNIGLINAIKAATASNKGQYEFIWVGMLPGNINIEGSTKEILRSEHNCEMVEISKEDDEDHDLLERYQRYCKRILWPVLHNLAPSEPGGISANGKKNGKTHVDDWHAYEFINKAFAKRVAQLWRPGDLIWIQDYHLMLVPSFLRQQHCDFLDRAEGIQKAAIGIFLHLPFPTSEIFRCLPVREKILRGLLASDLVGFQSYSYARHFLQACTRVLGLECSPQGVLMLGEPEKNSTAIGIYPIGIDRSILDRKLESESVHEQLKRLQDRYVGQRLIVSRDKADPVKGIRPKFQAFELFLASEEGRSWHGRVTLVQILLPVPGLADHMILLQQLASKINRTFGTLQWSPIQLLLPGASSSSQDQSEGFSFAQYVALLVLADVCLITSLRDGMNLASHEFIYCQEQRARFLPDSPQRGVLVLSEFAGTSYALEASIRVNPWDAQVLISSFPLLIISTVGCGRRSWRGIRHACGRTASETQSVTETGFRKYCSSLGELFSGKP